MDYYDHDWIMKTAAVACRDLDCGSAVSVEERDESSKRSAWVINSYCVQSGSALRECVTSESSVNIMDLICSGKSSSNITFLPLSFSQWFPFD